MKPRPFSAFDGGQIRGANSKTRVVLGIYTPWTGGEGVDGIVDMNRLPATERVSDRNGNYVGDIFIADLDTGKLVNVYKDDEHVGYFAPNGF